MSDAPGPTGAAAEVLELVRATEAELTTSPFAARLRAIADRLEGPLRVAIAGRVKAGKSTLLNALVGERLAPTDAGECTKIVSWYEHGQGYEVSAELPSGDYTPLAFDRADGSLDIQLGSLTEREVSSIRVRWPASTLAEVTLIDTPGLASLNDENSRRTRDFLDAAGEQPPDADAVIYLMRHLHSSDVEFLDAFMDRTVTAASPVNTVAVLSRADEIGAGRLDAMESSARIAERYRAEPVVHGLAATVVPVAGLLAETGLTLREDEAAALRALQETPAEVLEKMLLSVDQFCDVHASDLTVEIRRSLLDRLGMFGVRVALAEIEAGATTAAALAKRLVERSGLAELRRVITEHFLPRARVLQARSALAGLRSLAVELRAIEPAVADRLDRAAERIESSAVEFSRIRAAHLVASGDLRLDGAERTELERLLLSPAAGPALGLGPDAPAETIQQSALQAIERWRNRASDPLADPATVEVAEAAVRVAESHYVASS